MKWIDSLNFLLQKQILFYRRSHHYSHNFSPPFCLSHLQKIKMPSKSITNTLTLAPVLCTPSSLTNCHPAHPFSSLPSFILNPCLQSFIPLVVSSVWICPNIYFVLLPKSKWLSFSPYPAHVTQPDKDEYVPCFLAHFQITFYSLLLLPLFHGVLFQ